MRAINNSVISNNYSSQASGERSSTKSHSEVLASKSKNNADQIIELASMGVTNRNFKISNEEMAKISSKEQFDELRMGKYNDNNLQDGYTIDNKSQITSSPKNSQRKFKEIHTPRNEESKSAYETYSLMTGRFKKTNLLVPGDSHEKLLQNTHQKDSTGIAGTVNNGTGHTVDNLSSTSDSVIAADKAYDTESGVPENHMPSAMVIEQARAYSEEYHRPPGQSFFPFYNSFRDVDVDFLDTKAQLQEFKDFQIEKMASHIEGKVTLGKQKDFRDGSRVYTMVVCHVERPNGRHDIKHLYLDIPAKAYKNWGESDTTGKNMIENSTKNTTETVEKTGIEVSKSNFKKYGYLAAIITAAIGAIGAGVTAIVSHAKNEDVEDDDNYTKQGDDAANAAVIDQITKDQDIYENGTAEQKAEIEGRYDSDQNGNPVISAEYLNSEFKDSLMSDARADGIENAKTEAREQVKAGTDGGWGASAGMMGLGGMIAALVTIKNHRTKGDSSQVNKPSSMMANLMQTSQRNIMSITSKS